jgi:hypothetical protein
MNASAPILANSRALDALAPQVRRLSRLKSCGVSVIGPEPAGSAAADATAMTAASSADAGIHSVFESMAQTPSR